MSESYKLEDTEKHDKEVKELDSNSVWRSVERKETRTGRPPEDSGKRKTFEAV